jgi:hypothetical protein
MLKPEKDPLAAGQPGSVGIIALQLIMIDGDGVANRP